MTHPELNSLEQIVCNECQQNDRHRTDRSCKVAPEVIRQFPTHRRVEPHAYCPRPRAPRFARLNRRQNEQRLTRNIVRIRIAIRQALHDELTTAREPRRDEYLRFAREERRVARERRSVHARLSALLILLLLLAGGARPRVRERAGRYFVLKAQRHAGGLGWVWPHDGVQYARACVELVRVLLRKRGRAGVAAEPRKVLAVPVVAVRVVVIRVVVPQAVVREDESERLFGLDFEREKRT
jgi:hypothetical protein